MQLYGASAEYSLDSAKLLSRLITVRRFMGSICATVFVSCFLYLENYAAAYTALFLVMLAPLLYGYAYLKGRPEPLMDKIPEVLVYFFVLTIIPIVYFAKEVSFIYLIVYPATIALYSAGKLRYKWLLCLISVSSVVAIIQPQMSAYAATVFVCTYILVFSFAHFFSVRVESDNQMLASLALIDSLTEVRNRQALELDMQTTDVLTGMSGIVFFDLDDFKELNDKYGHVHGDDLLKAAAVAIQGCTHQGDQVYRYGGDEFIVVVRHNSSSRKMCSDVRLAIKSIKCKGGNALTVSAGVAFFDKNKSFSTLISDAEAAMCRAKESGRNRAILFGDPMLDLLDVNGL